MKVGERVIVVSGDHEGVGDTLIGEKGIIVGIVNPVWKYGCDVIVDLDSGINGLLFESDLELEKIK